jgi:hypothetical protein
VALLALALAMIAATTGLVEPRSASAHVITDFSGPVAPFDYTTAGVAQDVFPANDILLNAANLGGDDIENGSIELTPCYPEDVLAVVTPGSTSPGAYNAATCTILLTGPSTESDYQTAFNSITYNNTNTTSPNETPRTLTLRVVSTDGIDDSENYSRVINVIFNNLPQADPKIVSVDEDQFVDIVLTISDPDGPGAFTITTPGSPSDGVTAFQGAISCSAGPPYTCSRIVRYTPNANYNGSDSFTYRGNDGTGNGPNATVSITVNSVNDPPSANGEAYPVAGPAGITHPAATGVLANDTDNAALPSENNLPLKAILEDGPLHALTFVLNEDGSFTYTPQADWDGADFFTYRVQDSLGASSGPATATLNVSNLNSAPVITAPAGDSTSEDVNNPIGGVSIADSDAGLAVLQVRLTLSPAAAGTISVAPAGVLNFACVAPNLCFGDGTDDTDMRFQGTLANINLALAGLIFKPTPNANNISLGAAPTLTIEVNDLGNTGSGGPQVATDTIALDIFPVNDGPTLTAPAGPFNVAEDSTNNPIPGISTADIDVDEAVVKTVKITASAPNGSVSLGSIAGLATVTSNGPTINVEGTLVTINAALATFRYSPNLNYFGADTITVTVDDLGHNPAPPLTDTKLIAINVTAINDAPVITAPAAANVNEDQTLTFNGGNTISVADVDIAANPLKVTITVTNGVLSLNGAGGLAFTVGDGTNDTTMTFTSIIGTVNARLLGMTYKPNLNYNGPATLVISVDDQGAVGAGGPKTDTKTVNINVIAINDAPVTTVPNTSPTNRLTVPRNGTRVVGGISVADVDANGSNIRVTLQSGNANLKVTLSNAPFSPGLQFGLGQDGVLDGVIQITGSVADINAALNNLIVTAQNNYTGSATLVITTADLGNTGNGGQKQHQRTIYFTVTP